jgi:hypothetical protein
MIINIAVYNPDYKSGRYATLLIKLQKIYNYKLPASTPGIEKTRQ